MDTQSIPTTAVPTPLRAEGLAAGYAGRRIVEGLDLAIEAGTITALVGPNGCGKSTTLKALARLLPAAAGAVYLDGEAITRRSAREVAREVAVLPQAPDMPHGLTVGELVEQGRYAHVGPLRMLRRQDHEAVRAALAATRMEAFAGRRLDELSGGERQRAWIALALAQDTPILLLDEPTTYLDIGHQLEVLELIHRLNIESGLTIVVVLHDLNQASRYADRLVVMDAGRVVADGLPAEVLTPGLLAGVFRVHASVLQDPATGVTVCLPHCSCELSERCARTGEPLPGRRASFAAD